MDTGSPSELHAKMRSDIAKKYSEENSPTDYDCFYCGDKAEHWDHTIPHSYARFSGAPRQWLTDLVPACRECNVLLTNRLHSTLHQRMSYLCEKVKRRHKKLLRSADWSQEEINEMGDGLRAHIIATRLDKTIIRHRIYTLERNVCLTEGFEVT